MRFTVNIGGKAVKSKSWDFETMCIIDDARSSGFIKACSDAARYLFEDTVVDVDKLEYGALLNLCCCILEKFREEISFCRTSGNAGSGNGKLRDIYKVLFENWGILPKELARQEPRALFSVLTGDSKVDIQPGVRALYGL